MCDWTRRNNLPRVFVISVPKGGTNLLMQIVLGITGMVFTNCNSFTSAGSLQSPGQVSVMHLPYSAEVEQRLLENKVKVIFIRRDLRDIAVSMMHFIEDRFPTHILYPAYQHLLTTNSERLSTIINGIDFQLELTNTVLANELYVANGLGQYPNIQRFFAPFQGWTKSTSICQITYEELVTHSTRTAAIGKMVEFLWDDLHRLGIPEETIVSQMEANIDPSTSPTFRAGRIGDWKIEFTDEHKRDFKRIAGQTLIDLGYEQDLDW